MEIEDEAFRQMIESDDFDDLDPTERERFLLGIADRCIKWVLDRDNF